MLPFIKFKSIYHSWVMVGETYNFIVIVRGFLPSFVRYGKNTLTILQRELSSSLEIQIESTVPLAKRRQRFSIT